MSIKRAILIVLTFFAIALIGLDLLASWSQPQFQNQLELYQANLVLQAHEFRPDAASLASTQKALLGDEVLDSAAKQYEKFIAAGRDTLERSQAQLATQTTPPRASQSSAIANLERTLPKLQTRLGLIQVAQSQVKTAQNTWADVQAQTANQPQLDTVARTAAILAGLWSDPPQLLPNAEPTLQKQLDGWFRFRALEQLYTLQQRQEALDTLAGEEQQAAQRAFTKLVVTNGLTVLGALIGTGIALFLLGQWLVRRKQSLLEVNELAPWTTPWPWETVWEVLIFGFFLVGQLLLPLLAVVIRSAGLDLSGLGERGQAGFIFLNYLGLAVGGLGVLYLSLKPYLPLPAEWFRLKWLSPWPLWGFGGYLVALPLVIVVSLLNQQIWQGQGGSNAILPIVFQGKDPLAIALFIATAAIAAPIFEEILFRGFLLPSLTRYMSLWNAIALSSLIFAVAHLSLSEVLPLTVLGMVLGFVYTRSRNLLAPMLLHCLWNTGTLISLLVLSGTIG